LLKVALDKADMLQVVGASGAGASNMASIRGRVASEANWD